MPTPYGEFTAIAFHERLSGKHHVALVKGEVEGREDVLVRVHSECLTGDVFLSRAATAASSSARAPAHRRRGARRAALHARRRAAGSG